MTVPIWPAFQLEGLTQENGHCALYSGTCVSAALVTVARGWEPPSIPQPRSTHTAALSLGHEGKEGSTNTGCKVEEP